MSIMGTIQMDRTMLRFHRDRIKRNWRYRRSGFSTRPHPEVLAALKADGFAIIPKAIDPAALLGVREEMERLLDAGRCLNRVSKDSARAAGDLGGAAVFLDEEEMSRGQEYYRRHTNYVSVADPLVNCPSVVGAAFDELLIDIAAGYFGCIPGVGGLNLRKSFVNDLPEFDTLYFHSDGNSPRFLKFFFYLNDVDEDGGPFCYVRGSHREKFRGWRDKYRWTPAEIEAAYGAERILNLTGEVGDLIVADTTGFHRGTKVRRRDRSMLTVNYTVHREYWNTHPSCRIGSAAYAGLSDKQKAATDFAEVVEDRRTAR